jgi:Tfp pilus assembly protein FimV
MISRSTPPLGDIGPDDATDDQNLDPDSAETPVEPIRPAEAPRRQALALTPPPARLAMIGGMIAAALAGGAVGYWLGKRRAQRRPKPLQLIASRLSSSRGFAPTLMHLAASPIVRALAIRIMMRQISRQVHR